MSCATSGTWAIKHRDHGFLSANNARLIITDPVKIKSIQGAAILDTRTTARSVISGMERQGVPMVGYKAVPVVVRVCEVVK